MRGEAWKGKTPRGVEWTLVPRDGKCGAKWWNPDKGERGGYQWIATFASVEAAEAARDEHNFGAGKTQWTVAEWADFWLEHYKRPSPGTNQNYRYAVARIKRELGTRDLDSIDRPEGRAIANAWPQDTWKAARAMWNDAVRDGAARRGNPFEKLWKKKAPGRKDLDALTEDECLALAQIAEGQFDHGFGFEFATMLTVMGFVAVRPGELFALERVDLHLDRYEIDVRQAVDATRQLKTPKNGEMRTITVPPPAAERLARMPAVLGSPLVFHTPRGRRFNKSSFYYYWSKVHAVWRANGGRELDPYELRHAAATHFIERGVASADVALQLGHRDGGRLVDMLYGHPRQDPARDRLKLAFAQRSQDRIRNRGVAG